MNYCINKLKHINNKLKILTVISIFFTQGYHTLKTNTESYSLSQESSISQHQRTFRLSSLSGKSA